MDPRISMQSSSLFDAESKRRLSLELRCSKPDSFEIDRGIQNIGDDIFKTVRDKWRVV